MNCFIQPEALQPSSKDALFPPKAIRGFGMLDDQHIQLFTKQGTLTKQQQALLAAERLTIYQQGADDIDISVSVVKNGLEFEYSDENDAITVSDWLELARKIIFPDRTASLKRSTGETDISVDLNLDGTGESTIQTGLNFFDHMLDQIARHGGIDLSIRCDGDLEVDEHHTIEDVAIALGSALTDALSDKRGIERYGFVLPMDESRSVVALDLSGRPFLEFEGSFDREYVGDFPTEMVKHFFYSLAINLKATLHIVVTGDNEHHKIEACFKGFARCLRSAIHRNEEHANVLPSSKGLL